MRIRLSHNSKHPQHHTPPNCGSACPHLGSIAKNPVCDFSVKAIDIFGRLNNYSVNVFLKNLSFFTFIGGEKQVLFRFQYFF